MIEDDGGIVVAGETDVNDPSNLVLLRYDSTGVLDTSFGSSGVVILGGTSEHWRVSDLLLQEDGRLVVTGKQADWTGGPNASPPSRFAVARFDGDGSLDTSFDDDGIVLTTILDTRLGTTTGIGVYRAALDDSGKIVVTGDSYQSLATDPNLSNAELTVLRYTTDGELDTTFDDDGIAIHEFGVNVGTGSVAFQSDGDIVVGLNPNGGWGNVLPSGFNVVRLLGDPPPPAPPGITITPTSSLQTTEGGGVATFTVVLDAAPTGIVTITLYSSDLTEGTLAGATNGVLILTFNSSNWDQPQTVTVQGLDDSEKDGDINYDITFTVTSTDDMNYHGLLVDSLSLINKDNEKGGRPKK